MLLPATKRNRLQICSIKHSFIAQNHCIIHFPCHNVVKQLPLLGSLIQNRQFDHLKVKGIGECTNQLTVKSQISPHRLPIPKDRQISQDR